MNNLLKLLTRPTFLSFSSRLLVLLFQSITVILILFKLSDFEQGIYYALNSMFAINIFFDFGISIILIHFVSSYRANLKISNYDLDGSIESINLLNLFGRFIFKWYLLASLFLFILFLLYGFFLFKEQSYSHVNLNLLILLIAITFSLNFLLSPIFLFLEGLNNLKSVYIFKIIQSGFSYLLFHISLIFDLRLLSLFVFQFSSLILVLFFVFKYRNFIKKVFLNNLNISQSFNWKQKFLPLQLKIGLSSISGFLVFSTFVPIAFKLYGPIYAGQLGLCLTICSSAMNLASGFIAPTISKFGHLVSINKITTAYNLMKSVTIRIVFLSILYFFTLILAYFIMYEFDFTILDRLLPISDLVIFFISYLLIISSLPASSFLRSFKEEPLFFISISSGVITLFMNFFIMNFCPSFYVSINFLCINLIFIPLIFILTLNRIKQFKN